MRLEKSEDFFLELFRSRVFVSDVSVSMNGGCEWFSMVSLGL